MKIGFDATSIPPNKGGVSYYIENLLETLLEIDPDNKYVIFTKAGDLTALTKKFPDAFSEIKLSRRLTRLTWEQTILPKLISQHKLDIFHSPHYTVPFRAKVKKVVTFPDMTFFSHPEYHLNIKIQFFRRIIPQSAWRTDKIIAISQNTKNEIIKYLKVKPEKIKVIPLAVDRNRYIPIKDIDIKQKIKGKFDLDEGYLLYVGTLEPRKNIASLIESFFQLKKEKLFTGKLVLAGGKGWNYQDITHILKNNPYRADVVLTGYIDEVVLPLLFNGAAVFIYPSFYEGFGIPPLEAISCGIPVITSGTSSIPEVVGDAAILIDPKNKNELYKALKKVLKDKNLRLEMVKKGLKRAGKFSWEDSARQTLQLYQELNNG